MELLRFSRLFWTFKAVEKKPEIEVTSHCIVTQHFLNIQEFYYITSSSIILEIVNKMYNQTFLQYQLSFSGLFKHTKFMYIL